MISDIIMINAQHNLGAVWWSLAWTVYAPPKSQIEARISQQMSEWQELAQACLRSAVKVPTNATWLLHLQPATYL